jgi:AcrR family transcriptional regulator
MPARSPAKPAARRPKAARTRLDLDQRRAQLIELGFALFASRPYDEVHIGAVARTAGISKGLLYHYFPTKRDFYTATMRVAAERLLRETEIDESLPASERLRKGLDCYLEFVERYANAYVTLMRGGVGADPQVATIIEETRAAYMTRLTRGISELTPQLTPLTRCALRGWIGFVEATSLDWAVAKDVSRQTLGNLLAEVLLTSLQTSAKVAAA